ncbi:MAG: LPS export ABC transporter permease LptG, partial [Chitinophagia bacterium]|nr:LPS export ABC transporter permease LptG [Chitinophagia bacterium]
MTIRLFQSYIGKEIHQASLYVLVAFLAIFFFFDLIAEIDEVTRGVYRVDQALLYVSLGLPSRVVEIIPVAALIGTLWALSRSAEYSEFTVFRVSGLLPRDAIKALLRIGFPVVILTVLFSEVLAPTAEGYRLQVADRGVAHDRMQSGLWLRDAITRNEPGEDELRFVNVGRVLSDRTLAGIVIYEFNNRQRLVRVVEAKTGVFLGEEGPSFRWDLQEIRATRFAADGSISINTEKNFVMLSSLAPETISSLMTHPDRMSSLELYRYVQYLRQNKQQTERFEISLWKRLIYPWVIWIMMLLALPVAFLQARSGTVGTRVFAGILIGVAFHLLNSLFSNLGVLTTWPAPLMA